jgi:hypothetical protein
MNATPIESYARLVVALRDRLCEIGTTFAGVDQLAGLPDRYAQKLLGHEPMKRMGAISLFPVLQALGLKLLLAPVDPPALAKLQAHALWEPLRRRGPRYRPSNGRHGPAPKPHKSRRSRRGPGRPSNGAAPSGRAGQTSV